MTEVETLKLRRAKMGPDMENRYVDKALYYTMLDAIEGNADLELVGRNVFREDVRRPVVDDFIMDDETVLNILRKFEQREPV